MRYPLNDIYATIQGEGAMAGTPMVLIRLQGCAVGCAWCDTKETWSSHRATRRDAIDDVLGTNRLWGEFEAEAIAEKAREVGTIDTPIAWALITGGEPADHELRGLVRQLHRRGFRVAVETSGTADGVILARADWVCVSPKIAMPGGLDVLPEVVRMADEIKHVVGSERDVERLDALLRVAYPDGPPSGDREVISLQPVSESKKATELCVRVAMQRNWKVSIQTHKLLGLR